MKDEWRKRTAKEGKEEKTKEEEGRTEQKEIN